MFALKQFFFLFSFIIIVNNGFSQTDTSKVTTDTALQQALTDTFSSAHSLSKIYTDSLLKDTLQQSILTTQVIEKSDTSTYAAIIFHPYLPYNKAPELMIEHRKISSTNDYLFYFLLGLIFILGLVRVTFSKYFNSLFQLFFQTTFRQHQTRYQLFQDKLPSLLMNIFFVLSFGMLITLIVQYYNIIFLNFWNVYFYCCVVLTIIYLVKYLFITSMGWIFNVTKAANAYLFVIFYLNKMIGVIVLPLLFCIVYSPNNLVKIAIVIAEILVLIILIHRCFFIKKIVQKTIQISALHFFLYICAAEVIPLLLIYKVVFNYIQHY